MANDKGKSFLSGYKARFKTNWADAFSADNNPFDFTGQSEPGKISGGGWDDSTTNKIFDNFAVDHGPKQKPILTQGTKGEEGFFGQMAGPIAGVAMKSLFSCDMRLKHDVDCLTDMNLVKDDLADVAYFVKELQDS